MSDTQKRPGQGYRKLYAFEAAHDLVKVMYELTNGFPRTQEFGLKSQMRRAAVSVAANIVEGHALDTAALFARHLAISFGSCKELEYYFQLTCELGYLKPADAERAARLEGRAAFLIGRLLNGVRKRIGMKVSEPHEEYSLDSLDSEMEPT